jgi:ribosomal protein S27AE
MIVCNSCNEFLETIQNTILIGEKSLIKYALVCHKCKKESFSIIINTENIINIKQAIHQGYLSINNKTHFKQMKTTCPKCHNKIIMHNNYYCCNHCRFFLSVGSDEQHTPIEIKHALTTVNRILQSKRTFH